MNANKKILLIITFLLIICTGISISYAFFKVASSNNNANSNVTINATDLCMSLQLSSNNITLSNEYAVPVSDAKALSSDVYKTEVIVDNNCNKTQRFNLLLIPTKSNTIPIKALKYALVAEGSTPTNGTLISSEYILDDTIQKQLLSIKNETLKNGFSVGNGRVAANTLKTFYLYLWIDKDEGGYGNGITMNKSLNSFLTLGTGGSSSIGDEKTELFEIIEDEYNNNEDYVNLYQGDGFEKYNNSIYYFYEKSEYNNVLLGKFCWKIVRTTETKGIKLIYNGIQKDDGSCNNTEDDSKIGTSAFNSNYDSPAYVGYMYNTVYPYSRKRILESTYFSGTKAYANSVTYDSSTKKYSLDSATATILNASTSNGNTLVGKYTCDKSTITETCSYVKYIAGYSDREIYYYSLSNGAVDVTNESSNYVFGKTFVYANGTYTLRDTTTISTDEWATNKSNLYNYRYTCLNDGTTCSELYYVYFFGGYVNYLTLTNGKSIDNALNEMLYADDVNTKDSTIKTYIDSWYENNLIDYEDKLEDTILCNDRSIPKLYHWDPNSGKTFLDGPILFNSYYPSNASLECKNETDRFSMSNSKAKLKYPIGLLSDQELRLLEYENYGHIRSSNWTMSAIIWIGKPGTMITDDYNSSWDDSHLSLELNVRPSVSLKPGTGFIEGDGSYTSPFVIE